MARRGVVVADLAKRQFIVSPSDAKLNYNQAGTVLHEENDHLLKLVAPKGKSPTLFRFDLRTGQHTESPLPGYDQQISDPNQQFHFSDLLHIDGMVLLNDGDSVAAWTARGDVN